MNPAELYNLLNTNAQVISRIGVTLGAGGAPNTGEARIFWRVKRQDELRTCLVLAIPDELSGQSLDGPDGSESADVTVTCFAPTYSAAKALAAVVAAQIDNAELPGGHLLTVDGLEDLEVVQAEGQANPLVQGVVVNLTAEL